MKQIHTVGLDVSKNVFQVHCADKNGTAICRRKLSRTQIAGYFKKLNPCLVGMEVTGGAHNLGRKLTAIGHTVKLMPAAYVKPYVKSNKNDAIDAEAICEAVRRPTMRFVPIKTEEQQAILSLHRARVMLVKQRTQTTNAVRALLAEYGVVRPLGRAASREVLELAQQPSRLKIPIWAKATLTLLANRIQETIVQIDELSKLIKRWHSNNEDSRRLATIPGIGELAATALVGTIGDGSNFKSGRDFSAWLGLVPRQRSSGNKIVLGPINKYRNRYLRQLLYLGAKILILKKSKYAMVRWATRLASRKPYKVAIIALANKIARIVWALLRRKEVFCPNATLQRVKRKRGLAV